MRNLFFLILNIFLVLPAYTSVRFRNVGVRQGLSDNYVRHITPDKVGRLWICTSAGIDIYDGYSVRHITIPDGFSPTRTIHGKKTIWVKGHNSVLEYTANGQLCSDMIPKGSYDISSSDDATWFLTPDNVIYRDVTSGTDRKLALKQKHPVAIASVPARKGMAYILYANGTLSKISIFDHSIHNVASISAKYSGIYVDSGGTVWLYGGPDNGLLRISTSKHDGNGSLYLFRSSLVNCLDEMPDRRILVGTNTQGLFILDNKGNIEQNISHSASDRFSLPNNHISSVVANNDMIIAGTSKRGIAIGTLYAPRMEICVIDENEDISFFHEGTDGNLFIGTDGRGLLEYTSPDGRLLHTYTPDNSSLTSASVIGMITDKVNKCEIISTYGGGMYKLVDGIIIPLIQKNTQLNYVRHMIMAPDKSLWAGTFANGLFHIGHGKYNHVNSCLRTDCITGLALQGNNILVATSTGVYVVKYPGGVPGYAGTDPSLRNMTVYAMIVDRSGKVWLGNRQGLTVLTSDMKVLARINSGNGLAEDNVKAITEDAYGNIWVSGDKSLSCVIVNRNNAGFKFRVKPFYVDDAIEDISFNKYALSILADGRVLAGGLGRYLIITPEDNYPDIHLKTPRFVALTVDGYDMSYKIKASDGSVNANNNITETSTMTLNYGQNFTLEISTLDFADISDYRYQYRLDDDTKWVTMDENRCTFNRLASGKYRLQVRVTGSPYHNEIYIHILPPWWRSDLALSVYAILVIGSIIFFIWYNRRNSRRKLARQKLEYTLQRQEDEPQSRDEIFLNDAKTAVETNITDETFGVEALSMALGMSRSNLYKRISELTGKTPIEFIRLIRIRKGKKLLDGGEDSISQCAYNVGLSPKQFSKYFRDEYGVLPSEYIRRRKMKSEE